MSVAIRPAQWNILRIVSDERCNFAISTHDSDTVVYALGDPHDYSTRSMLRVIGGGVRFTIRLVLDDSKLWRFSKLASGIVEAILWYLHIGVDNEDNFAHLQCTVALRPSLTPGVALSHSW